MHSDLMARGITIAAFVGIVFAAGGYLHFKDRGWWSVYSVEQNCQIIDSVPGYYTPRISTSSDGRAYTSDRWNPPQNLWACDDGKRHWRTMG